MFTRLFRKLLGLQEYVSELDQFLTAYDKTHPRQSHSQLNEVAKYAHIYEKRDIATTTKQSILSRLFESF